MSNEKQFLMIALVIVLSSTAIATTSTNTTGTKSTQDSSGLSATGIGLIVGGGALVTVGSGVAIGTTIAAKNAANKSVGSLIDTDSVEEGASADNLSNLESQWKQAQQAAKKLDPDGDGDVEDLDAYAAAVKKSSLLGKKYEEAYLASRAADKDVGGSAKVALTSEEIETEALAKTQKILDKYSNGEAASGNLQTTGETTVVDDSEDPLSQLAALQATKTTGKDIAESLPGALEDI